MIVALLAPVIAPYQPIVLSGLPFTPPGHGGHLLGTDEVGYDVFSRVLYGLRTSLVGVLIVVTSGVVVGGTDRPDRRSDRRVARLPADADHRPVPRPPRSAAGHRPGGLLSALPTATSCWPLAIVWWPFYARIMRGEIRSWRSSPHIEAARLAGTGAARRAVRHLLPGAMPAIWVTASLDVGNLVITLAGLAFLGLGAPAPAPELGAMSARGLQYLLQEWWVPVMPALAIFLLALFANLAGDAVGRLAGGRR